ncbi:MAG TPA: hypothetical protein VH374_22560 [Polyangia bacterium]|nr:hypothetical protein [Polyangia bacterium]
MLRKISFIAVAGLVLAGCGSSNSGTDAKDVPRDNAIDQGGADNPPAEDTADTGAGDTAAPDVAGDAPTDNATSDDTAPDAADDTAPDGGSDVAPDTAPDEASGDGGSDVAPDTAPDAAPDASGSDVAPDSVPDAAPDAPVDNAPDAVIDHGAPELPETAFHWPSMPPASNPFSASTSIREVVFTGRHALYGQGDTFIPTWGSDDNIYTPFTYGTVDNVNSGSGFGWAKFTGSDPLNLTVAGAGTINVGAPGPYYGAFPSASVILNGVWYYGGSGEDGFNGTCGYWCVGGPFLGFWTSTDYGAHWTAPPDGYAGSLFGETDLNGGKVKMGGPRAVDFGKEMQHSPDGKIYFIGTGATDPNATDNWVTGDQIYMARVTLTPSTANDVSAWEFFAGRDGGGNAIWSSSFASIQPLLEWKNQMGSLWMTYIAPLKKYLLAVSRPHDGFNNYGGFDTFFLESDSVSGPFRMVQYLQNFGVGAYYVTMPSRFISDDGRTAWIEYSSGDFTTEDPPGSRYAMSFQEVVLDLF